MNGKCAYCLRFGPLKMSHAIPKAAFTPLLTTGNGSAIGIPMDGGNAHLTSDTGAAPLLCQSCERDFNRNFDAPMINALKALENEIFAGGFQKSVSFAANQMAHAIVSVAWRICLSPATMYSEVTLSHRHMQELDGLMRLPSDEILQKCTVRLGRLSDSTPMATGGFSQELMKQFIKTPQTFSLRNKSKNAFNRFAIDWTMFGFLIHLVAPRLSYPNSKKFGGLKHNSNLIRAVEAEIFEYRPMRDALVAGYAAHAEGRLTAALKRRDANS